MGVRARLSFDVYSSMMFLRGDPRAAGQLELIHAVPVAKCLRLLFMCYVFSLNSRVLLSSQLSATDVSARTTMKGAAKCDKHCELQNSVNQ